MPAVVIFNISCCICNIYSINCVAAFDYLLAGTEGNFKNVCTSIIVPALAVLNPVIQIVIPCVCVFVFVFVCLNEYSGKAYTESIVLKHRGAVHEVIPYA
jgi:hypothetical protein